MPSREKQKDNKNDELEEKRLLTLFAEDSRAFTHPDTSAERNKLKALIDSKIKELIDRRIKELIDSKMKPVMDMETDGVVHKGLNRYAVELIHRCPNFSGRAGWF